MFDRDPSPDYASSTHSHEPQPARKRLGGVRKIVGDPNYDVDKKNTSIPDFDFGVTQSLTPLPSRPGTATGRRSPLESTSPVAPLTPTELPRAQVDRVSPNHASPLPSPHSRPSSRHMWHPGLVTGRQSPGGLTPEEFVQQRAAMARLPGGYVPRRTMSSNRAEQMKTPSPEQSPRGKLQKRNTSRPSSRGSLLDFSSNLSAREQEHVARMTGSPLLNLPDRNQVPDPSVGLIGAISAREQDRRNMKEGISSQLAHAAIVQRQQQAQSAYHQQMQSQHRPGVNAWGQFPNSYGGYGYFPQQQYQSPQQHYHEPQRQYYQPPSAQNSYGQNQYRGDNSAYREYYAPQSGYRRP